MPRLGEAAGVAARGGAAQRGAASGGWRRSAAPSRGRRGRRVLALEWLDPPFVGGHWVPEMIEIAGGDDVSAGPGDKSRTAEWDELRAAKPDVAVAMPCGYDVEESAAAGRPALDRDRLARAGCGDTRSTPRPRSRGPGPRLVDGVELLAHLLHPDRVNPPINVGWRALRQPEPLQAGIEPSL